ncbi:immunity 49 family protein [Streptomyces sp. XM4193]|uniref:immunity 49 family protein n=1 Tax=Streptomyces sp. XM4193 TaxID=2929782 RepID=UPI001FFC1DCF|nr:immunity 49 family protein [Streptomyces sp. XM4193]MCK1796240.1 immunity 49 family protein [Streptomyces sp. XM4193]
MFHVERHQVTAPSPEFLRDDREGFINVHGSIGYSGLSLGLSSAKDFAAAHTVNDPTAEEFESWEALTVAMQIGSAMFASVMTEDLGLEVMIGHQLRPVEVSPPQYYTNAGNWLDAFWLAVICREADRVTALCEVPIDLLRQSSPSGFDEYIYPWVDALQGYWLRRGDVVESLMRAMELSAPEELRPGSREPVVHLMSPVIPVFIRFLQRDVEGFNEALADSLKWHKQYWDTDSDDRRLDDAGYVAFAPLAVACMARDSGLPVEVESEYLPKHLLEGSWLNEFPT